MLTINDLYQYQLEALRHQIYHPKSMLWLGMGLGKTPITLTTIVNRMNTGLVKKTLVFAPLRVCYAVWEAEAKKWEHTKNLRFSIIHGGESKRKAALFRDADIYLINYEGMSWLADALEAYYPDALPFDFCVYDEITKVKDSQSQRMKGGKRETVDSKGFPIEIKITGWRKVFHKFKLTTGLTGSPASNGLRDLFGQYLVLDQGERLGGTVTEFRNRYCSRDYSGFNYIVNDACKVAIYSRISDITLKMGAKDYLDLPECKVTDLYVDLPVNAKIKYKEIEKDMFTALESGTELEIFNKASVSNKCLQFANGAVYTDLEGAWERVHDAKLDALAEVLEDANGQPVLLGYNFKTDAERIMTRFKKYKPVNFTASKFSETSKIVKDWQDGKIKLLIGHPASIGHGLDGLQHGGNILVFFGCPWSLESYEQLRARIDRNGQKHIVFIIRILCRDTVDEVVIDALMDKDTTQNALKNAIEKYKSLTVTRNVV